MRISVAIIFVFVTILCSGCVSDRAAESTAPPATAVDPEQANVSYWLERPAVVAVDASNFDKLWAATEKSARQYRFMPDRQDYRLGLLTTFPLVSKQFFELWQNDVVTHRDMEKSSLLTQRRSVRFEFVEESPGNFRVVPKVVVEQFSSLERRVTSIEQYQETFSAPRVEKRSDEDTGPAVPEDYWYAVGRDPALEKCLAIAIADKIPDAKILKLQK